MASEFFRFKENQSASEDQYNHATLREFQGELIGDEIELALGFYQESITALDVAMQKIDQLLEIVRTNEALPEYEAALAQRFAGLNVNELPRIGPDKRQIVSIEDLLLVKKSELATLRQFTEDTIKATRDLSVEISEGVFVATLLGAPNPLKEKKKDLGFGRITVSGLFSSTASATGLAVGDIFPLGFEFLLPPSIGGTAAFHVEDSGSSAGGVGILASGVTVATLGIVVGGWYARRRWQGKQS